MALAEPDDVRAALRRDLTESEDTWIDGMLEEASDAVLGYLSPFDMPDPVPGEIVRATASVVADMLRRANILPDTQSMTADSYAIQFAPGATSSGPYLSEGIKRRLAPFKNSVRVIDLSSERF
jgi:hypothetical protein